MAAGPGSTAAARGSMAAVVGSITAVAAQAGSITAEVASPGSIAADGDSAFEWAMNTVIYNIPINLVPAFRGREVIVRSRDPAEIVEALPMDGPVKLVGIQLL